MEYRPFFDQIVATDNNRKEMNMLDPTAIREAVQEKYGEAARTAQKGAASSCGCGCSSAKDPITSDLYDAKETAGLPTEAVLASLGCGNPTALAELKEGE